MMIGSTADCSAALTFFQKKINPANSAALGGVNASSGVDDATQGMNDARASEAQKRLQGALETMERLATNADNVRANRKAAARQKMENLKKEMDALRLTQGMNPKAAARAVARIARELAAAAKDYAGSGGIGGATSQPAPRGSDSTNQDVAESDAASASDPASAAPISTPESFSTEGTDAEETTASSSSSSLRDVWTSIANEHQAAGAESTEDMKFKGEVRKLASALKAFLVLQKKQSGEEKPGDSQFMQEAEKALRDIPTN